MSSVVRPGGQVFILEFGKLPDGLFSSAYTLYSEKVLPTVGGMLTGYRSAYEYLLRSSSIFPSGKDFIQLMDSTKCFASIEYKSLFFGIANLYRGVVAGK